jgi:fructoselysine-6-P-deglycase FrlB-like protein/hydroxymethylpyrimidine pyrophosphatase-like HAD family hydrolase
MGKAFDIELKNLPSTYEYASFHSEQIILSISHFLESSIGTPLLLVGSGGSFSAAKTFEALHCISGIGNIAKAVTPLELSFYAKNLPLSSSVILSANGNNADTVNAYKLIRCSNSPYSLIICLNEKSKLKKASEGYNTIFAGNRLPTGKDGYLAVNTLFATIVWLSKAYYKLLNNSLFLLPKSFADFDVPQLHDISYFYNCESIIILYSGTSAPVAVDIESKFSEAAFGNVLLSDYRNFAHGRHLWLDRRGDRTLIVALITPEDSSLVGKTLSLIPEKISIMKIETKSLGTKGILELLLCSFELTKHIGASLGFDPGNPDVPEYGKKLYHVSYSSKTIKESKNNDSLPNCAILKKYGITISPVSNLYKKYYDIFLNKLHSTSFNQLVFDFDATLKDRDSNQKIENEIFLLLNKFISYGISIAIATGRGKSVRSDLQARIARKYWDNIRIGYYNGGDISSLADNNAPNKNIDTFPLLEEIAHKLNYIFTDIKYDLRPKQITVFLSNTNQLTCKNIVLELVRKYTQLKAVMSGHSVDIIPVETSKLNLIDRCKKTLCIGDSGQYGGNDYELLSHEYSLSANHTSMDLNSCWNLAPLGIINSRATLFYLRCMEIIKRNSIKFNTKKLEVKF